MSATKRGSKRHDADFYATPKPAFKPLLPFVREIWDDWEIHVTGQCRVWEPASGDGRLILWLKTAGVPARGDDARYGYDFRKDNTFHGIIVTNPPFSLALEFCDHAIKHSPHVFMLLRLNFLASRKRRDWWNAHKPDALFVLSERPSFTDDGKTDATDYAWFYWGNMHRGFYFL